MAALKIRIKKLEEVGEDLRDLYEADGDGFMLSLDDNAYKRKLDEFRQNNRELHSQKETLDGEMKKFKGVDPSKYKAAEAALKKLEEIEDKKLIDAGQVEEVVSKRVDSMRKDFESQVKAKDDVVSGLTEDRDKLKTRLSTLLIDGAVRDSVNKIGRVRKGALPDVLSRAHSSWTVQDNGELASRAGKGSTEPIYNTKGDPISLEEWTQNLMQDAPFLFEGGGGGGAPGGDKGKGEGGAKQVRSSDLESFNRNLEAIAKGDVKVVPG